jgi:hypothetical protein
VAAPHAPAKQNNTLGLIALIVGIIGFVFACIPGALIVGWVLLPIAFILGIVGLLASGKAKGTSIAAVIVSVVGAVVGVGVFVVVVGDAFGNAFRKSDLSPSAPTAINGGGGAPQPSSKGSPNSQGSRENPLPIGATVSNQDWQVTLGAPREAWAEISATNQFNDPPKPGREYWIVPITATYTGDKTGNPTFGITVEFVGSDTGPMTAPAESSPTPLPMSATCTKAGWLKGTHAWLSLPAQTDGGLCPPALAVSPPSLSLRRADRHVSSYAIQRWSLPE